jgi:hypothetical protein
MSQNWPKFLSHEPHFQLMTTSRRKIIQEWRIGNNARLLSAYCYSNYSSELNVEIFGLQQRVTLVGDQAWVSSDSQWNRILKWESCSLMKLHAALWRSNLLAKNKLVYLLKSKFTCMRLPCSREENEHVTLSGLSFFVYSFLSFPFFSFIFFLHLCCILFVLPTPYLSYLQGRENKSQWLEGYEFLNGISEDAGVLISRTMHA